MTAWLKICVMNGFVVCNEVVFMYDWRTLHIRSFYFDQQSFYM